MKPTHQGKLVHLRGPKEGQQEVIQLEETKTTWVSKRNGVFRKQDGTPVGARYKPPYKLILKSVTLLQHETEVKCEPDTV